MLGTFNTGQSVVSTPEGLAFDGANIWVANAYDDTVTKLRASDGALLGTFAVGDFPTDVLFDGANIWVISSTLDGTIAKLRPSDGALLGKRTLAIHPTTSPLMAETCG